jgi:arginase
VQLEKNCFSLFIGGDQSISIGITKLLLGQYKKLGILLLESHPNANTEKTTPTGDMHGMCTAFILRRALENYANAFFGELPKPKIFMLGLRVFDRGELENIANEEVKVLDFKRSISMDLTKLVNEIKDFFEDRESIYISFAANVLTPSLAPGVCTPSKDGYVPEYVEEILRQLVIQKLNITALEVSEINLLKDKEGQTLTYGFNIIKKLLNEIFST